MPSHTERVHRGIHLRSLAALLTLDGASLTSGEVEELRRTCLAQGGM